MIQAFKEWCVEEWRKQSPFEKRMIINSVPAMLFTVVIIVLIAAGSIPTTHTGPDSRGGASRLVGRVLGFIVWQRWRSASRLPNAV